MKDLIRKIAMGHLMSPEYKGNMLEYIENRQEEEKKKEASIIRAVKAVRPWYETIEAVKKTIDHFIGHTGYNMERRGGNFYFHPKDESFHESKSYPMMFVLPNGDTFISDASHKEREHEEKASKRETPQHEPPMGAKKHTMSTGIKNMMDQLSEKKDQVRYQ
jgi:hypothetical protein